MCLLTTKYGKLIAPYHLSNCKYQQSLKLYGTQWIDVKKFLL